MKRLCVLALGVLFLSSTVIAANVFSQNSDYSDSRKNSRYDYVYYNPPRQSLEAWGRYIYTNTKLRYVHSPSRLKRAAHAARIDAYNYEYENY